MFGPAKPKYQRLTTNLRLSINRLKLLEKKKTELAIKARREISEYLMAKKEDRARIRVGQYIFYFKSKYNIFNISLNIQKTYINIQKTYILN